MPRSYAPIESEQLAAKLAELGTEHEYVVYPSEGHGFPKREHRIDCYTRMLDWFQRHLDPSYRPKGSVPCLAIMKTTNMHQR